MNKSDNSFYDKLTKLVFSTFWLNGFFLNAADQITVGSRLTSARWQVLGAVLHEPLTVPAIARNRGLSRQSVQRIADILVTDGFCEYKQNPAHRRSKLLASTDQGLKSIQNLYPNIKTWSKQIEKQVSADTLNSAILSINELISNLR